MTRQEELTEATNELNDIIAWGFSCIDDRQVIEDYETSICSHAIEEFGNPEPNNMNDPNE
jgi:hypothetical protein